MVHVGPCVLQQGAHLYLKAVRETRNRTDVMQRQIAETVYLVDLALIDGVFPVNIKKSLYGRCHLIYIVYVERDDP